MQVGLLFLSSYNLQVTGSVGWVRGQLGFMFWRLCSLAPLKKVGPAPLWKTIGWAHSAPLRCLWIKMTNETKMIKRVKMVGPGVCLRWKEDKIFKKSDAVRVLSQEEQLMNQNGNVMGWRFNRSIRSNFKNIVLDKII